MKLAIFGGTGTVGSALVSHALDAGHQVRLLPGLRRRSPGAIGG